MEMASPSAPEPPQSGGTTEPAVQRTSAVVALLGVLVGIVNGFVDWLPLWVFIGVFLIGAIYLILSPAKLARPYGR